MKTLSKALFASCLALTIAGPALAQDNPMVGGAAMRADMTIVENAMNSADHTTLVAAVQAAGLAETLQGEGPFTVFAPTNAAFEALPAGTLDSLMKPENREMLVKILTCHVVGAKAMAADVQKMVAGGGGKHVIETLGGCKITAEAKDGMVVLTGETGAMAAVTIADVVQSNGVIHVIDKVLLPAG